MDPSEPYSAVFLVQSGLDAAVSQRQLNQLRQRAGGETGPIMVFFHAEATGFLESASLRDWSELANSGPIDLKVCQSARARRVDGPLPPPFQPSTLVQFWSAVMAARCLFAPEPVPVVPGRVLVRLVQALDDTGSLERLELVLAAASLDLELMVAFEGDGLTLWSGTRARSWQQLRDHDLARLVTEEAATRIEGLERMDQSALRQWQARSTVITA